MPGIEAVINKIIEEAKAQAADIISKARSDAELLLKEAADQANIETERIIKDGQLKAAQAAMRIKTAAVMENRKVKLSIRKELIDSVFSEAEKKLKSIPDPEYSKLMQRLIIAYVKTGDEEVLIPESDYSRLAENFISQINEGVEKRGMEGMLKISAIPDKASGEGGFILRRGDIDINATFRSILRLRRDELELLAASALF